MALSDHVVVVVEMVVNHKAFHPKLWVVYFANYLSPM